MIFYIIIGIFVFLLISTVLENLRLKKEIIMYKRMNRQLSDELSEFFKSRD